MRSSSINPCSSLQNTAGFPLLGITERLIPAHLTMLDEKECYSSYLASHPPVWSSSGDRGWTWTRTSSSPLAQSTTSPSWTCQTGQKSCWIKSTPRKAKKVSSCFKSSQSSGFSWTRNDSGLQTSYYIDGELSSTDRFANSTTSQVFSSLTSSDYMASISPSISNLSNGIFKATTLPSTNIASV